MSADTDRRYMGQALELAARGTPAVFPNPRVGAVVVKGRQVVGEGWHKKCGGAHAEVMALKQAGRAAWGATLYVTLEPCSHHGRTPPCVNAVLAAGIKRVVIAQRDPNPVVDGVAVLRQAGVSVTLRCRSAEAEALNPGFNRVQRTGWPYLHLKLATTMDGRMALSDGRSQWITGPAARRATHHLRGRAGAVLTGIETVLHDDPQMTVRHGPKRRPLKVILDSRLRLKPTHQVVTSEGSCHVITTPAAPARRRSALVRSGTTVHLVDADSEGRVDLSMALVVLAELGCLEVHVEAGPTLSSALLRMGAVSEVTWFQAPVLFGEGRGLQNLGVTSVAEALSLEHVTRSECGVDQCIHGFLRPAHGLC